MTDFPSESLERSADALRRIAEALEAIAAHMAKDGAQRDRVEETLDDFTRREVLALEKIAAHLAPVTATGAYEAQLNYPASGATE